MEVNVKDYGAKGDGVTDDTDAIRRTVDAAMGATILLLTTGLSSDAIRRTVDAAMGGPVVFPRGTYKVSVEETAEMAEDSWCRAHPGYTRETWAANLRRLREVVKRVNEDINKL